MDLQLLCGLHCLGEVLHLVEALLESFLLQDIFQLLVCLEGHLDFSLARAFRLTCEPLQDGIMVFF